MHQVRVIINATENIKSLTINNITIHFFFQLQIKFWCSNIPNPRGYFTMLFWT